MRTVPRPMAAWLAERPTAWNITAGSGGWHATPSGRLPFPPAGSHLAVSPGEFVLGRGKRRDHSGGLVAGVGALAVLPLGFAGPARRLTGLAGQALVSGVCGFAGCELVMDAGNFLLAVSELGGRRRGSLAQR